MSRTRALLHTFEDESLDAVQRVVELEGRSLHQFVADYSPWDDLADFARTGDERWARTNLVSAESNYHFDTLWVYSRDQRRMYGWTSAQARAHIEAVAAQASVGGDLRPGGAERAAP
jgi:sensor domain CHASE-containing protein